MESRRYPTDLSDEEWRCICPHLPEPSGRGRPRLHGLQTILDAVFYVLASVCGGALAGTRTLAQASWTPSRSGPRGWEATSAASTPLRRWKGENATCWWTQR